MRLARPKVLEFAAITDRFNALAGALDAARAENLALSRRLLTAQDDERRRTALELHDEVGPSLFGLKANTASIAKIAASLPEGSAAAIAGRTAELTGIIEHLQSLNRAHPRPAPPDGARPCASPRAIVRARQRMRQQPLRRRLHLRHRRLGAELRRHRGPHALSLRAGEPHQRHPACRGVGRDGHRARGRARRRPAPALDLTVRDNGHGFRAGSLPGFGLRGCRSGCRRSAAPSQSRPAPGAPASASPSPRRNALRRTAQIVLTVDHDLRSHRR